MSTASFFDEWLKINSNKIVTLNMYDEYYTDVYYYDKDKKHIKSLDVYHAYGESRVGYGHKIMWYKSGKLKNVYNYKDGVEDGVQEAWYDDTQGELNGKLKYIHNYKDGKQDGIQEMWYQDGHINYIHNYKDGKPHGEQQGWDHNIQKDMSRQMSYHSVYDMGKHVRALLHLE